MAIWDKEQAVKGQMAEVAVFSRLLSAIYDQSWYGKLTEEEVGWFAEKIGTEPAMELGCGTGRISAPLLERGCDLYGVEGSRDMLDVLHAKLSEEDKARFILWNALQVPYPAPDACFASIIVPFSTFGLVHNNATEVLGENRLLKEFHRMLMPGGKVVINEYRIGPFDRCLVDKKHPPWLHCHLHPEHGNICEEQTYHFEEKPNRILEKQIVRKRKTRFIRESDGAVLEEHHEEIPIWDTLDYPILASDAGFCYEGFEQCRFHEDDSVQHIMTKS